MLYLRMIRRPRFSLFVYILSENEYNNMIGKNILNGGRCFEH